MLVFAFWFSFSISISIFSLLSLRNSQFNQFSSFVICHWHLVILSFYLFLSV
uniref:Cytochrome b n=1 Tax=Heterorhabditis bacteriophora TaxID=37862 RepID=A0A1I7WYF7_HETBA